MMRTLRLAAAALAVVLVSTACATIPTTGPVIEGPQLDAGSTDQVIRVIARPPETGMSPTQIVSGFVQASASFEDDHAIARLYLTPEAAASWRPEFGTTVYDGTPALSAEGPAESDNADSTVVELSATEAGRISPDGRYQVSSATRKVNAAFTVTTVDGQWRISNLPTGLLLSRADVDRAFRSYNIYFFNPDFTSLVPDPRLFATSSTPAATKLTRALLTGPSEWLAPGVRTAFPDGSSLAIDAVPVFDGVASIDLDPLTRLTDDATRQAMSAQLAWTLRQVSSIRAFTINAGGQLLQVPGVATPQPIDSWPLVNPNFMPGDARAFVIAATGVRAIANAGTFPVPGAAGRNEPPLTAIAVDLAQSRIAGLTNRAAVVTIAVGDGAEAVAADAGPGQSRPTFGRDLQPWFVSSDGVVRRLGDDGVATAVSVEGLPVRSTIQSIALSRDGTKAALVTRRGPRASLLLAVVTPRETGVSLTSPVRVESRLSDFLDVAWSDADRLVTIAAEGAENRQVYEIDLKRSSVRGLGAPAQPLRVAAAPGLPILVGTGEGVVKSGSGSSWQVISTGSNPAYPGS
jgi:hypothetical protein